MAGLICASLSTGGVAIMVGSLSFAKDGVADPILHHGLLSLMFPHITSDPELSGELISR